MVAITVKSIKILNINLVFYFLIFQVKSCSHWGVLAVEGDGQRHLATSCVGSSQHLAVPLSIWPCMCKEVMCSFPQELGGERVRAGAGCTQEGPLGTSLEAQTTFPASAPQEYLLETHRI